MKSNQSHQRAPKLMEVLENYYYHEKVTDVLESYGELYISLGQDRNIGIYNDWGVLSGKLVSQDFIGTSLEEATVFSDKVILRFTDLQIAVDLREKAYRGPEAFQICGPGDLILVWRAGDEEG